MTSRLNTLAKLLVVGVSISVLPVHHASAQQITFDQVLAAPDDMQLNLDYARQEVNSGRLQQAASALERLLLLKPNWDSVRLFYGVVLYRLDDMEGAIRELSLLENRDLSPTQEQDRVRYLTLAQNRSAPFRFSARYTLGARLDTNPGRTAEDIALRPLNDEGSDLGFTGSSQFRAEADVATGPGDYVFLQNNGHINEFFEADTADLISSNTKAGIVLHGADRVITPYVTYGSAWLQHERFRQTYGGGVDTDWTLSSQVSLQINARSVYENYETTSFSTIGSVRDGWRKSANVALKYRPTDTQLFKISGGYADKDARFDGYSYQQGSVRLQSLTLLGEGRYLNLLASYTRTQYEQPDGNLSPTITRDDDRYYVRAAVGSPLQTLFSRIGVELPENIGDIVAQIGVSYTRQDSSINSLDHRNWSGDLLFTKRFRF